MNESSTNIFLKPAEKAARDYGIDTSLIEASLEKTPTERLQIHQAALDTIYELRRAFRRNLKDRHQSDPQETSGT